jgi:hypothetical protein
MTMSEWEKLVVEPVEDTIERRVASMKESMSENGRKRLENALIGVYLIGKAEIMAAHKYYGNSLREKLSWSGHPSLVMVIGWARALLAPVSELALPDEEIEKNEFVMSCIEAAMKSEYAKENKGLQLTTTGIVLFSTISSLYKEAMYS